MKAYEITQQGFEGSTSDTDHLIKWVKANDLATVEAFSKTLNPPGMAISRMEWMDNGTEADGIDCVLHD